MSNTFDQAAIKKMYGWYDGTFKRRVFASVEVAQSEIRRIVEEDNARMGKIFGYHDPNEIVGLYNYIQRKNDVVAKPKAPRPRVKAKKLTMGELGIIGYSDYDLFHIVAAIYRFWETTSEIKRVKIADYIDSTGDYYDDPEMKEAIAELKAEIRESLILRAIIVDGKRKTIIDGGKRLWAMKSLGFKTIPAYIVTEL
jgi:hypothetical protein